MLKFPFCKVNLGLSVERKREDGFHDVSTILFPVALFDILEVIPADDSLTEMNITGTEIPGDHKSNLVFKAYDLLKEEHDLPAVKIHLHKIIPIGAGLGGGSSDGSAMLQICNKLFSLRLSDETLKDHARKLGSDCTFFIDGIPALSSGKGDQLKPVKLDLSKYHMFLVKPPIHINTAEAYEMVLPEVKERPLLSVITQPVRKWNELLKNDFEISIFKKFPKIEKIKMLMYDSGAVYASMTGTGSAVFGLFDYEPEISSLFPDCFTWSGTLVNPVPS